jgi:DNA-binding NarL/FixJ family response regulator
MVDALTTFDDLGANWEGDQLRRAMRAQGISTPTRQRGGGKGYGDRLSPREEEVARLAASGLTNRAIAQELFLSPRTVAHHLERAMRKMGASSRTMLADRLRQSSLGR